MKTLVIACALGTVAISPAFGAERAAARLIGTDGKEVGSVLLEQTPSGVLLTASATGLSAGVHAFHIHETGQCDPADGFKSAGGHYAPGGSEHGFKAEGGPHAGDLPNVHVGEDGILEAEYFTDRVSLRDDAEATVFDDDGSAFVIHSDDDDYQSQPSGAAGDRIACGVIEAQ
jgi:Cu-Zn family superoxide dismutase